MRDDDERLKTFRAAYPQFEHLSIDELKAATFLDDDLVAARQFDEDAQAQLATEQVE